MAIIYCSNNTANGYAIGNDTPVDPTSKLTPYLTATAALDYYAGAGQDGDTIIFNDGEYIYTGANNGRWICNHENFHMDFENDFMTTLVFSGTGTQGMRVNGSDTQVRNITMGKGIITTAGAAATKAQVVLSGNGNVGLYTVNWSAKLKAQEDNLCSDVIGFSAGATTAVINILEGSGAFGTTTEDYRPFYQNPSLDESVSVDIDIQAFEFDLVSKVIGSDGSISISFNTPNSGTVNVSGVTGTLTDLDDVATTSYAILIKKGPDNSTISNCNNLSVIAADNTKSLGPFSIASPVVGGVTTDGARIIDNKNCQITSKGGFLALIGNEGQDSLTPNGIISGNEFTVTNMDASSSIHGICHIGCVNGLRENNIINGAAIGSLTKRGSAVSRDNVYRNIGGTSNSVLYFKGAESGSIFENETVYIADGFDGQVELAAEDTTVVPNQDTIGGVFTGTKVLSDSGSNFGDCTLFKLGNLQDVSSTATSSFMEIDSGLGSPESFVALYTDALAATTLEEANALSIVSGWQYTGITITAIRAQLQSFLESRGWTF